MEWNKEIDQRLLMPIKDLVELLALEVFREAPPTFDDLLEGKASSTSDKMGKHQRAIVELLEKGCLLDKIQTFRGDKQVLHDLIEARNTISDLREAAGAAAFYHALDSGLPPLPDASNTLAGYMVFETVLWGKVNALEVIPGEVVRWLNSVNEGQGLLPASLRDYLAASKITDPITQQMPGQPQDEACLTAEKHAERFKAGGKNPQAIFDALKKGHSLPFIAKVIDLACPGASTKEKGLPFLPDSHDSNMSRKFSALIKEYGETYDKKMIRKG